VWLDLLLFGVLLLFTLLGAWRGTLETALRLGGWVAGYAAAVAAAAFAGEGLAEAFGITVWLAMPLAGTLGFFAVQFVAGVLIAVARRHREPELGGLDRAVGAALGATRGALLVVLIGWLGLLGDALQSRGQLAALPPLEHSAAARWSGVVIESGAGALLGHDPGARAAAAFAARPRQSLESMQAVLEHPRVRELQNDRHFWTLVEAGDVDAAIALPSFDALAADDALRQQLASLGLVDAGAAAHPIAFRRKLEQTVREASARLQELRRDPEVQALLQDPEVLGMVERGDALGLLSHPRFQSVLRRDGAS
jgi:uncharacterized membrane protein required for colicin V production